MSSGHGEKQQFAPNKDRHDRIHFRKTVAQPIGIVHEKYIVLGNGLQWKILQYFLRAKAASSPDDGNAGELCDLLSLPVGNAAGEVVGLGKDRRVARLPHG